MKYPQDKTRAEIAKGRDPIRNNVIKIGLQTVCVKDAETKPQEWLWDGYIPLATSTLFAGSGGIGKSQLLLWIASLVSNGATFSLKNRSFTIQKGSVVIMSAEDNLNSSIVPRLKAVNADCEKIFVFSSIADPRTQRVQRFIELDQDLSIIEENIKRLGDVRLVIIDPVTAYLGRINENKSAEVRNFILHLNELAEQFNLSILLNTHTRKKSSGESTAGASDEIMGSGAWYNTVRQAFLISRDHENKDRILFINCKSNCGAKPEPFDYTIEPVTVDEVIEVSRIKLLNGDVNVSADEAANKDTYDKKLITDEAKDFILRELRVSSKTYDQIKEAAARECINLATLKLARQKLKQDGYNIIVEPSNVDRRKTIWYIGV
jgi:putative DNA primase/helicase